MEPALEVINSALTGDPGARSFLERTTSIYVLDATDTSKPKTYGCWNFIHQAMNEIERREAKTLHQPHNGASPLIPHARLLASMALRVARRSPATDQSLVATCIDNAAEYSASTSQSQWLMDLNLELREIVMGRIAAMAFDFTFHRPSGPHAHSSFADRVVMDTFCAILSANAVSGGPESIRHFCGVWIIPSFHNLPSFSVAAVVRHLGSEATRTCAPVGTKDMLQTLSVSAMSIVLVPTLAQAVSDNTNEAQSLPTPHQESSVVAAMALRAVSAWCDATNLSLPQIKHICSKVHIDIVSVLNDAMYSDSHPVIDALAQFIESAVQISDDKVMSQGRMNQVRHIIGVDDASFRAQFTPQQLKTIESSEMASIVDELVSAVALQRFRFTDRQNNGDHDVCRNLARIGAAVCSAWLDIPTVEPKDPESGAINLLVKAGGYPFVNVCAIALPVLTRLVPRVPAIAVELLPVLQRRAILPHHVVNGLLTLDVPELCGVNFHEFQHFRSMVLADTLVACYKGYANQFMDSCTAAVEEFCSVGSTEAVSLQLEAALFCIEKVAGATLTSATTFPHREHLNRMTNAFLAKPRALLTHTVTRERLCSFLRSFSQCYVENDSIGPVSSLVMTCFLIATNNQDATDTTFVENTNGSQSRVKEAALAIKEFLVLSPSSFTDSTSILSLSALWEASNVAANSSIVINLQDRMELVSGLSRMIASLPMDQQPRAFETLMAQTLGRLDSASQQSRVAQSRQVEEIVATQVGDEIRILATMARGVTDSDSSDSNAMESDCNTPDGVVAIPQPFLETIHKGWASINHAAACLSWNESVCKALETLLANLLPSTRDDENRDILQQICILASSTLGAPNGGKKHFGVAFDFLCNFLRFHGQSIERTMVASLGGNPITEPDQKLGEMFENQVLVTIASVQDILGNAWTCASEQGNGQDARESVPSPARVDPPKSNEALGCMLTFSTKAIQTCPVFLFQLPSAPDKDRDEDKLLRRAVDSAVVALNDTDPEIVESSIAFLMALAKPNAPIDDRVSSYLADSLSGIESDAIARLMLGCCGKYSHGTISSVAKLFLLFLRSDRADKEARLIASLQTDQFLLGDPARHATLSYLLRGVNTVDDLVSLLSKIWSLHRVEDMNAMPASDEVARFIQLYSR